MKIDINYIYECKDGFKYVRSTPQEILKLMEEDYKVLNELATGKNDFCHFVIDKTNEYFPKGNIFTSIDGCHKTYSLYTEVSML
jgi:hypothetical protein